jgi:hypothetical protein
MTSRGDRKEVIALGSEIPVRYDGMANPKTAYEKAAYFCRISEIKWNIHLHITRDMAMAASSRACRRDHELRQRFSASAVPMRPAPRNVASEDGVPHAVEMGIETASTWTRRSRWPQGPGFHGHQTASYMLKRQVRRPL